MTDLTAPLGPTRGAAIESREDRATERQALREERLEEREDAGGEGGR